METKHTPTPWDMTGDSKAIVSFYDNHLHEIAKMIGQTEYGWSKKANAAFIVRAVNAHDALVEALGIALGDLLYLTESPGNRPRFKETIDQISTALKLATGE